MHHPSTPQSDPEAASAAPVPASAEPANEAAANDAPSFVTASPALVDLPEMTQAASAAPTQDDIQAANEFQAETDSELPSPNDISEDDVQEDDVSELTEPEVTSVAGIASQTTAPQANATPRRRGRPRRDTQSVTPAPLEEATSTQDEDLATTEGEPLDAADWDDTDAEDEASDSTPDAPRRSTRASSAHGEFDAVFREWTRTRDPQLRERLILMNRNLVSYIARRFMDRGEMSEDIVQQGLIGLINALDHFDPNRGVRFATFATPTIMGEIRRYFRDKSWGIRVPRRLQELNQVINNRIEDLTQELNRSPTYAEIARALNLPIEEVVEALEMGSAMEPISIDEEISFGRDEPGTSVGDQIGECDPQLEGWGDYAALETALQKLPEKERRVLQLAYFHDHSQVEIARHMKVSQMFVSRLQRRALAHLRELMNSQDI